MSAGESQDLVCPNCGKRNPPTRTLCWLCYAALRRGTLRRQSPAEPIFDEKVADAPASLIALMVSMAVVCFGVFLMAPGLGIAMAVLLVLPFVRTNLLLRRRAEAQRPTSTASSVLMLLGSIFVSVIVLIVVSVVAFGTFCFACIGASAVSNDERYAIITASGATIVAVGAMGYAVYRWIRSRWYQDLMK